MYKYPLSKDSFSLLDRLAVCKFILNSGNQLTEGKNCAEIEKEMAKVTGAKNAIFVSSGSTANQLLCETYKQSISKEKLDRTVVLVPAVTWSTSVSPWCLAGFKVKMIDIDKETLSFDIQSLRNVINDLIIAGKNVVVFTTALIGKEGLRIEEVKKIRKEASRIPNFDAGDLNFFLDACESTLTNTKFEESVCAAYDLVTTSTFFSHFIQSVEGGFLFVNNKEYLETALCLKNHGMIRKLPDEFRNKIIKENKMEDERFFFLRKGQNYRNSEINAILGRRDLRRFKEKIERRKENFYHFTNILNYKKVGTVEFLQNEVPFCLPLNFYSKDAKDRKKKQLEIEGIESRPVISGNLSKHPAFSEFEEDFPNADEIHNNWLYIGLHDKMNKSDIETITFIIND